MESKTIERRFDLDWLRVLAILSVFVYHSTGSSISGTGMSKTRPLMDGFKPSRVLWKFG